MGVRVTRRAWPELAQNLYHRMVQPGYSGNTLERGAKLEPSVVQLTSRAARLTHALLSRHAPASLAELARGLAVSERALRYDLDIVDVWLKAYGLHLRRKPKLGVWIEGDEAARAAAINQLRPDLSSPVVPTAEERAWFIIGWLLTSETAVSVSFLAETLGVSRRTLYYDLARLKERLAARKLHLDWRSGCVSVGGDEVRLRDLLSEAIERLEPWPERRGQERAPGESDDALSGEGGTDRRLLGSLAEQVRDPRAMTRLRWIVSQAERVFGMSLAPTLKATLVSHLLVAVARTKQGHRVVADPAWLADLRQRPEWGVGVWIAALTGKSFGIDFPEDEVGYITLYLSHASARARALQAPGAKSVPANLSGAELGLFVRKLIEKVSERIGVSLVRDVELRAGLLAHFTATFDSLKAGLSVRNPLLAGIRARYPVLHSAVRGVTREASDALGWEIPDEEAGWVVLHLGAALERVAQRRKAWRALVVCASGVGVGQLLKAQLSARFPEADFRVVSALDEAGIARLVREFDPRLIIATLDVPSAGVPVLTVPPLLTGEDLERIASAARERGTMSEAELLRVCREIAPTGSSGAGAGPGPGPDRGHAAKRPGASRAAAVSPAPGPAASSLASLVSEDVVRVGVTASDAADAIRQAGEVLVAAGSATAGYVDKMVELYRTLGPYMVLGHGVALPHASPEDGALRLGLGVVVLRRPIDFGSDAAEPVRLVVAFASPDHVSHLRVLTELVSLVQSGLAERVTKACTPRQVTAEFGATPAPGPQV